MYQTSGSNGWHFCYVFSATPCSNLGLPQNPLCKCWILEPMSNSAPTVRILSKHLLSKSFSTRDKWVPVTTAWRVLGLRMGERRPIWRVAANILNKQSRTADKGCSSNLGLGEVLTTPHRKNVSCCERVKA
jgi:hypothetical protein